MQRIARLIPLVAFCSLLSAPLLAYDKGEFLNFTIFNLPPEYFAGIPLEDRAALFQKKASKPEVNGLDYGKGYFSTALEENPDGNYERIWIKLLPRDTDPPVQNPYSPLIYIHTASPVAGDDSYTYTTRVVMWKERKGETSWVDVTKSTIPESVDLSQHLPPIYKYAGANINPKGYGSSYRVAERLIWEDWELHRRDAYPFYDDIAWDAPLDAERLAVLAFKKHDEYSDHRELAELIAHAALKKDERFRALLDMDHLREAPVLSYALAAYDYALNKNESAIDFIVEKVAEEGNGDTDSKWMLSYFDEWDRTLEIYSKFPGTDGAAAEANYMFVRQREHFFPENFKKFWKAKMDELEANK